MELKISNRKAFISELLVPASNLVDNLVVKVTPGLITAIVLTSDNSVTLLAEYRDTGITGELRLNVPDVKRFIRALQYIEEDSITLNIEDNCLAYKSNLIRFKYYLFEDSVIAAPNLNLSKIKSIEFDSGFTITQDSVKSLIRGTALARDVNKIYLFSEDNIVYGDLTDRTRQNTDSFIFKLNEAYTGPTLSPTALNIETIRQLSTIASKVNIDVKISTKLGIFMFDLKTENTDIKYIAAAFVS